MKIKNFLILASVFIALGMHSSCTKDDTKEFSPLSAPKVNVKKATHSAVEFEWSKVEGAVNYVYQILQENDLVAERVMAKTAFFATAEGLDPETSYILKLKAVGENSPEEDSEWGSVEFKTLEIPTEIIFEDEVLESYILSQVPSIDVNKDKKIQFEEAAMLKELEIGFEYKEDATEDKCVKSLSGLEYFTSLERLNIKYHSVQDVSPIEGISTLTFLNIGENPVSEINLSKLSNLKDLRIYGTGISELDLSAVPLLEQFYAQRTAIEKIDFSELKKLEGAYVNECTKLTEIIAVGLENLTRMDAVKCNISSAKVSDCASLIELHLNSNKLTEISLKGLPKLMRLNLYDNQIESIDLKNLPMLMWLFVFKNQLTTLDLSGNAVMMELSVSDNKLETLDLSANPKLTSVEAESMPLLKLINLKNGGYDEYAYYAIKEANPELVKVIVDEGGELEHVKNIFKGNTSVVVSVN